MYLTRSAGRRLCALTPAAGLLLALCLLAGGAQAMTASMNTAGPAAGASLALAPFPGAHDVPGSVQAEDFDAGGEGVAYHDTEPANLGGAYRPAEGVDIETAHDITDVGWIRSGEWLDYTVNASEAADRVPRAHRPRTRTRLPSGSPSWPNGVSAGTVDIHSTGGFDQYDGHVSTPFALPAGETTVRLSFDGVSRVNLDNCLELRAARADPRPDAGARAPGLHARPPHPRPRPLRRPDRRHDHELRRRLRRHGPQHRGHRRERLHGRPRLRAPSQDVVRHHHERHRPEPHRPDWDDGIAIGGASSTVVEERRRRAERQRAQLSLLPGDHQRPYHPRLRLPGEHRRRARARLSDPGGIAIERCSITGNGVGVTVDMLQVERPHPNLIADCDDLGERRRRRLQSRTAPSRSIRNCTVRANGGDGLTSSTAAPRSSAATSRRTAGPASRCRQRTGSDIHGNWITGNGHGVFVGGDWPSQVRNNYLNNTDNGFFGAHETGLLNYEKTAGAEHRRRPVPRRQLLGQPERHGLLPDPPGRRR